MSWNYTLSWKRICLLSTRQNECLTLSNWNFILTILITTNTKIIFDVHISVHRKYISKVRPKTYNFSRSIYFYKLLYMFQAVPPPIIKITKLYIQRQVLSNQYCCLLLSWMRWNSTEFHLIHVSSRQQYWFDNTWRCMYSSVVLMMGGGTAWNM